MKHHKILHFFLLMVLLYGPLSMALAHDSGLSQTRLQLQDDGLVVQMVLARKDIGLDTDIFSTIRDRLTADSTAILELWTGTDKLLPDSVNVREDSVDSVMIELLYHYSSPELRVRVPLLEQLPRGHRQYFTVWDAGGNLLAQYVLDAGSPQFLLNTAGSNDDQGHH